MQAKSNVQTEELDLVQHDDDKANDILITVRQGKEETFDLLSKTYGKEGVIA